MNFRFHFERALQASAYLLRLDGKRMGYLRLLKLLYIADREWLAETGESITGDRAYAMKYGPVLSNIYDLIKGNGSRAGEWDDYIHTEGYCRSSLSLTPAEVNCRRELSRNCQRSPSGTPSWTTGSCRSGRTSSESGPITSVEKPPRFPGKTSSRRRASRK